ncbi:MAG TPA: DNA mismatch repair endonuclease MutH [Polyangiaceae bacterium]|nr:DNA mismatch repair endonuclease MutH [Polyangiaceae bacterium]
MTPNPPRSEAELARRADALAGLRLGALAEQLGLAVPREMLRAKGWVGQLLELALGASAGSRDEPDFPDLGVELKSLPIDARGLPKESTFVCTIELCRIDGMEWASSRVRRKLERVLWVPVEADPKLEIARRRVGQPLLWSPSPEQESALRFDWEELVGLIGCGQVDSITGHWGKHLQVRPKASSSRARRRGLDPDGAHVAALPRGFYLRTSFTASLLREHYCPVA